VRNLFKNKLLFKNIQMSSSRSIAAARNRRASGGEQPLLNQGRPRPNTSIGSQPAFAQQQQQQQFQQQNRRVVSQKQQSQPQPQPQRNFKSGQTPGSVPIALNKISVSDAIGLITIRLGRVEQFIQNLDEQGVSENENQIDKDLMNTLTERIYNLENKPLLNNNNNNNLNVDSLKNQIASLEKELFNLKEFLKTHNSKLEGFISETEQKFLDVDAAFVELEKNEQIVNEQIDNEENNNNDELIENNDFYLDSENVKLIIQDEKEDKGPTFTTVDLKNMISQELANAEL
jgi:hypothetical protein